MSIYETILEERIENDFRYHAPSPEAVEDMVALRSIARELAHRFADMVPVGRELATALTKLEEAIMWANAGISRNQDGQ